MKRASIVWTTSREGTNLISFQELMTSNNDDVIANDVIDDDVIIDDVIQAGENMGLSE